jgi:effector-binding domain-containing protein
MAGAKALTEGWYAVATHRGPYRTLSAGYRALGAWLAASGKLIGGEVREVYLTGPGDGVPESKYHTELAWPVEPGLDAGETYRED